MDEAKVQAAGEAANGEGPVAVWRLQGTATAEDAARLRAWRQDPAVRCILLLGHCSKGEADEEFLDAARFASKPMIAAVAGPVLDLGMALVANCAVAIGAQGSSFGLTAIRNGAVEERIVAAVGRAVGQRRALEWAVTGRVFQTDEALRVGLLHNVSPAMEIEDRGEGLAAHLARLPQEALRQLLRTSL